MIREEKIHLHHETPCCTQPNVILRLRGWQDLLHLFFLCPQWTIDCQEPPLPLEVLFDEPKKWISIHTWSFYLRRLVRTYFWFLFGIFVLLLPGRFASTAPCIGKSRLVKFWILRIFISIYILYISICLSVYLALYLPITYLSTDLSIYLPIYLSICVSVHLSICLQYLCISLSICLSVCLSMCLSHKYHVRLNCTIMVHPSKAYYSNFIQPTLHNDAWLIHGSLSSCVVFLWKQQTSIFSG